jgi:hypothetical protein
MQFDRVRKLSPLVACFVLLAWPAAGQTPAPAAPAPAASEAQQARDEIDRLRKELEAMRLAYEARLAALEQQLAQIGAPQPAAPPVTEPVTEPAPEPVSEPAPPPVVQSGKVFNPDIAVIGNFIGVAGRNPMSDQPSLELSEVEATFQAVVDPFARADFFLSAGPEGVEIEEGFITFNTLPGNFLLKAGKMRAQFGKVNTTHSHQMQTADRPLVVANLLGGEEGLSDAGLSLSHLVANPLLFLELTGEVYRGRSEVFETDARSRLTYVGRVRAYRDLTEGTNLDVGTSAAFGPTAAGPDSTKRLMGIDATFRYRPLRRAIYKRFMARSELIWSTEDQPAGGRDTAFGFYALGDYQFARRWYAGARYDRSARALDTSSVDTGGSLFLTFWPSEFSQVRGQLRRTRYAEGVNANEFLLQFRFGIGAHGAHVF